MLAAVSSAWALLLGIALIMLGNGLQGTLLGVRATLEGFGTGITGLVMTGYFVGFLAGSVMVPRLLANVGHIRVFAALASLASGAALLHIVFVTPLTWGLIRVMTGFCFAGLYVVAESWINDAATNRTRGQLLSVYMIMVMGGMAAGQLLMNLFRSARIRALRAGLDPDLVRADSDHAERGARAAVRGTRIHRCPCPVPGVTARCRRRMPGRHRAQRHVLDGRGVRHRDRARG